MLSRDDDAHDGMIAAHERVVAEELLRWDLLRYGCVALPGSILAAEERPWRVNGWKTLQYGWRFRYRYERAAEPHVPPEAISFYTRIHNWYQSPFKGSMPWLGAPR
jgi:hypothetical protein